MTKNLLLLDADVINEITELSTSPEEMSIVLEKLKSANIGLDAGELECITIIETNKVPDWKTRQSL